MFQIILAVIIFYILKWIIKLIFGSSSLPRNVQNLNNAAIRKKTNSNRIELPKAFPVKQVSIKVAPVKVTLVNTPPVNTALVKSTPANNVPVNASVKAAPIKATPVKIEPTKKDLPTVTKVAIKDASSLSFDFHREESRERENKRGKLITNSRSLEPTSINAHDKTIYRETEKLRVMSAEKRAAERNARHFAQLESEGRLKLKKKN